MTTSIATTAIGRIPRLLLLLPLLLFYEHATGLIIPEELPTILSLIYSNIPPIKKGTDSRLGIGFRLGEHADFQILIELGPQSETDPIGTNEAKRRRDAMFGVALKGDLGPFAQAVAKYQMERRIQKEMERLTTLEEKLKKIRTENKSEEQDTISSNWLTKWRKEMLQSPEDNVPLSPIRDEKRDGEHQRRVGKLPIESAAREDKLEELTKLYVSQDTGNERTTSRRESS